MTTKQEHRVTCFEKTIVVNYLGREYIVLTIYTTRMGQQFEVPLIIDMDDYQKISGITWFLTNKYINSAKMTKGHRTDTYLHQFIMNHVFDGKIYVDHINRICQDNRKVNLRLTSQTGQNFNQRKRKRTTTLPEGCGIDPQEIPTNVEYHPTSRSSGNEHFEVSIKMYGKRVFRKKTTKSKDVTLIDKLQEAKNILRNISHEHPEWFEGRSINGQLGDEGTRLYESYFEILRIAGIGDPFNQYIPPNQRGEDVLHPDE